MTYKETAKIILGARGPKNKPSVSKQIQILFSKQKKL